jgi:hypothetical protein
MRALYQLSTQIKSVKEYKVDKVTIFEIEYIEPDKTPWQLPVVSAYVKAHQKVVIFEQYNKLINAGIVPVSVRVDGIELKLSGEFDTNHSTLDELFDIGPAPNQWKYEAVKACPESVFNDIQYLSREVVSAFPGTCVIKVDSILSFNPDVILPRLTHFSGSGGNGKTQKLVELMKVYPNLCATAPTHDAAECYIEKMRTSSPYIS